MFPTSRLGCSAATTATSQGPSAGRWMAAWSICILAATRCGSKSRSAPQPHMTPLAHDLARRLAQPLPTNGPFRTNLLRAAQMLRGAHFFEVTVALPLGAEVQTAIDRARGAGILMAACTFLPAPIPLISTQSPLHYATRGRACAVPVVRNSAAIPVRSSFSLSTLLWAPTAHDAFVLFAPKLLLTLLTGEAIQTEPKRMRAGDKPRCQKQGSDTG